MSILFVVGRVMGKGEGGRGEGREGRALAARQGAVVIVVVLCRAMGSPSWQVGTKPYDVVWRRGERALARLVSPARHSSSIFSQSSDIVVVAG